MSEDDKKPVSESEQPPATSEPEQPAAVSESEQPAQASDSPAEHRAERAVEKVRTGRTWAALAFIFAVVALGASGYLAYVYYSQQAPFNTDLRDMLSQLQADSRQIQESRALIEKDLKDFGEKLQKVEQVQDTLGKAVEKVVSDLGRERTDWILSETEQLLLIANHRLQLARDVDTAVTALRAADRRLQQLADPSLLPVRRLVASEIAQLQSLERADVPGIALTLGGLTKTLDKLPLAVERRMQPPALFAPEEEAVKDAARVQRAFSRMWEDLRGLVRIRTNTDLQKPLLAPEQNYFLRENLRLLLYGTQLAVLQGDVSTYEQNLKSAQTWIDDYFDTDSRAVIGFREELQRLADEKILIELPDISASLEALRAATSKKVESQLQAGL